jgi:hypothetical protein
MTANMAELKGLRNAEVRSFANGPAVAALQKNRGSAR